jgi:hypothetical protein
MSVHYGPMSPPNVSPGDRVVTFLRKNGTEMVSNIAVILVLPLMARWLWSQYSDAIRQFGLGELMSRLAGEGGWTDVGWEVASAVGLIRGDYSAYDSLEVLHPLIGMDVTFVDLSSHSHPPMSLPLGLPLVPLDYGTWLAYWAIVALLMMAWSMRLLNVPAHIAYPLALVIALSVPGRWGLVSTYPVSALLVAWAWRSRDRWLTAGVAYGLFGATRGIGLVLLAYPLVRRQWRTLLVAAGVVLGLLAIALFLERDVVTTWLTTSRASIEANMQRADLLTVGSIFRRYGYPEFFAWIIAAVVGLTAWRRGSNLFWVLNWVILAISPIAWFHTIILAIPLLVMVWRSGRLGQVTVFIVAAASLTQLVDPYVVLVFSIGWMTFIMTTAAVLVQGRVGASVVENGPPRNATPTITEESRVQGRSRLGR